MLSSWPISRLTSVILRKFCIHSSKHLLNQSKYISVRKFRCFEFFLVSSPIKAQLFKTEPPSQNITQCYDKTIITILNFKKKKKKNLKWFLGLANFFSVGFKGVNEFFLL